MAHLFYLTKCAWVRILQVVTHLRGGETSVMARPIMPTPVLKGKQADKFDQRLKEDLKRPVSLVDTPRLEQARKLVADYAIEAKKRI